MSEVVNVKKLLWLDMEMTGLDVEREVVIEVAAIVTDYNFKEIAIYHSIIKQPQSFIDGMDEWNTSHHGASGLTAQIASGRMPSLVEADLIAFIDTHMGPEPAVLAGNSIGQDRLFINRHFPKLAARLHYRMMDVTAWKIMMTERFGLKYQKKGAHRAIDDIRESISEMEFYLRRVQASPQT
jgi:oligoribonuclease